MAEGYFIESKKVKTKTMKLLCLTSTRIIFVQVHLSDSPFPPQKILQDDFWLFPLVKTVPSYWHGYGSVKPIMGLVELEPPDKISLNHYILLGRRLT